MRYLAYYNMPFRKKMECLIIIVFMNEMVEVSALFLGRWQQAIDEGLTLVCVFAEADRVGKPSSRHLRRNTLS